MQNWTKLAGLGGFLAMSLGVVVSGCGDDPAGLPTDDGAKQQCGATVTSMIGQACTEDGRVCPVPLVCQTQNNQIANCTCSGGTFSCTDPFGNAYDDTSAEPQCSELGTEPSTQCGGSVADMEGQSCEVLRSSCRFNSERCPGEFSGRYDVCDCKLNTANERTWQCVRNSCGDASIFEPSSSSGNTSSGGSSSGDAGGDASD